MRIGILAAVLAGILALSAGAQPKKVVATFSILGDITAEIGGDNIVVSTLVKAGLDAHGFEPRPSDVRLLTEADLIVANGLGFETWLDKAVKASRTKAPLAVASQGVSAMRNDEHGHDHGQEHHDHGALDPHAWQDTLNVKIYATNIAEALARIDPANAAQYRARAVAYRAVLDKLDGEIKWAFAAIPKSRRIAVTNHDAFAYFGRAYGVQFRAPIGVSTEAEPSAADVAALIRQIRAERITAVFVENMDDPRLIEQIARETGAKVGPQVYSDALSVSGGPASSYVAMMRHNAKAFATAMR